MSIILEDKVTDKEKKDIIEMIVNYMDSGFLDNITAMFKSEPHLYTIIADLIQDERIRVRIGVTALMEELTETDLSNSKSSLDNLKLLLKSNNPTLRGDVAYLISLIGGKEAEGLLKPLLLDPNPQIKEIVRDFFDNQ